IREEIHSILLRGKEPDERRALLISLVNACKILPVLFPNKSERKIAEKRAEAITNSEIIGKGIKEIVNEITAALMLMVIHVAVF
ncbi:MAG: GPP34 family phosphoprotein, partial [Candidatus Hodarchaeota archaeon]